MPTPGDLDAVVVGSGPNGLVAAIVLARAGLRVRVLEAQDSVGGGARTAELTLPGFRHDICSAVHPLGVGSPVLRALPLESHGLEWIEPRLSLAHPLDDLPAAVLAPSVAETSASLGEDGDRYRLLVEPFLGRWNELAADALRPATMGLPRHPLLLARFGARGLLPARLLAAGMRGPRARALLAGMAAHAIAPLTAPATGAIAVLFALAGHELGWAFPRGGSQAISDALASHLRALGGEVVTGERVTTLASLPRARAYLLDLSPWAAARVARDALPAAYVRRLAGCAHGPSVFKVDYALAGPVPWRDPRCAQAGTVHLGGSEEEIAAAIDAATRGRVPEPPFLIAAQPSLFDPSRAPAGGHVLWVYGHVPTGWRGDLSEAIERQLERFAPGFRDLVLARAPMGPHSVAAHNESNVDGDITGGAFGGRRAFLRPLLARVPYATPNPSVFLCSSATPPGPGVHGMCGMHAARLVLRRVAGRWTGSPLPTPG